MSARHSLISETPPETTPSPIQRSFDFVDRMMAVFLISANLVFLMFAITAGAAQCSATAYLVDDPDQLAAFFSAAKTACVVSPAIPALILLFAGNALYISGIFARQTPVRVRWRW